MERMKENSEKMDAKRIVTNLDATVGSYGFLWLVTSRAQGGTPLQVTPLGQGSCISIAQFQLPALSV